MTDVEVRAGSRFHLPELFFHTDKKGRIFARARTRSPGTPLAFLLFLRRQELSGYGKAPKPSCGAAPWSSGLSTVRVLSTARAEHGRRTGASESALRRQRWWRLGPIQFCPVLWAFVLYVPTHGNIHSCVCLVIHKYTFTWSLTFSPTVLNESLWEVRAP